MFFLNICCGYFIKEISNGFQCLDTMIQTLGIFPYTILQFYVLLLYELDLIDSIGVL